MGNFFEPYLELYREAILNHDRRFARVRIDGEEGIKVDGFVEGLPDIKRNVMFYTNGFKVIILGDSIFLFNVRKRN